MNILNSLLAESIDEKNKAYRALYIEIFPGVLNFVKNNSGTQQDAHDLIQDVFVILINKIADPKSDLEKVTFIEAYTMGIAKKQWYSKLRARGITPIDLKSGPSTSNPNDLSTAILEGERYTLKQKMIAKYFKALNNSCQEVLELYYFENKSLREIAQLKNFSENYAKQKKHRCMKKLRDKIFSDEAYKIQKLNSDA